MCRVHDGDEVAEKYGHTCIRGRQMPKVRASSCAKLVMPMYENPQCYSYLHNPMKSGHTLMLRGPNASLKPIGEIGLQKNLHTHHYGAAFGVYSCEESAREWVSFGIRVAIRLRRGLGVGFDYILSKGRQQVESRRRTEDPIKTFAPSECRPSARLDASMEVRDRPPPASVHVWCGCAYLV